MKDNSSEEVKKKIEATRYPNISKANNTKIIVIGSLIAILLIFILSILFPPDNNTENAGASTSETTTETTTEATTEKEIKTGWQTIDGKTKYVNEDGSFARSQ